MAQGRLACRPEGRRLAARVRAAEVTRSGEEGGHYGGDGGGDRSGTVRKRERLPAPRAKVAPQEWPLRSLPLTITGNMHGFEIPYEESHSRKPAAECRTAT